MLDPVFVFLKTAINLNIMLITQLNANVYTFLILQFLSVKFLEILTPCFDDQFR
jgi:hypothetical protein